MVVAIHGSFLFDIAIIIIFATVFAFICKRLKQPLILGYILAGITIGPLGFKIVTSSTEMVALAEMGIAFLLFGAALEIDVSKLKGVANISAIAGIAQFVLTVIFGIAAAMLFDLDFTTAIYIGVILAFSSTMIVVKILTESFAINSLHGRLMIGLLIVQDILAIVAMSFLSSLGQPFSMELIAQILLNGLGLLAFAILVNRVILLSLLNTVAKSQELFFLTVVSICFLFMGFAYYLGFSIAIGAFIAGLSLSMFRYNVEISGEIRSLRNFFSTLFFVSLGMQFSAIGKTEFAMLFVFLAIAVILKPIILSLVYLFLGYGSRLSMRVGLSLAQVSEFSFIISAAGVAAGHISPQIFSVITIVIIVSVLLTPYLFKYHMFFYDFVWMFKELFRISSPKYFERKLKEHAKEEELPAKSVILVGCDKMGERIINELGDKKKILVVDYNPDVVDALTKKGIYSIYGDAYSEPVMRRMNIQKAKVFILTIPDSHVGYYIIKKVKEINKDVKFIARANFADDAIDLYNAGADMVIMPEIVAGQRMAEYIRILHKNPRIMKNIKKRHIEYLKKEMKLYKKHFLDRIIFK